MKSFVFEAHVCGAEALKKCAEVVGGGMAYHFPTLEQAIAKRSALQSDKGLVVSRPELNVHAPLSSVEYGFTYNTGDERFPTCRYQSADLKAVTKQWKNATKNKNCSNVSEIYVQVTLS